MANTKLGPNGNCFFFLMETTFLKYIAEFDVNFIYHYNHFIF